MAMAAERPEKQTVRGLWVDEVRRASGLDSPLDVPLYLTLPGKQGGDIQALIEAKVVELEETEAIRHPEAIRLVAVESSPSAYVELQRQFPGLKVLNTDLRSVLRTESVVNWPSKDEQQFFRARVINLDLNSPLEGQLKEDQLWFPVLALVKKVSILHANPVIKEWTLCLTLHGELKWSASAERRACQFLAANFKKDSSFAEQACAVLGQKTYDRICNAPTKVKLSTFSAIDQQRIMMVLVPKQIAYDTHSDGWAVETIENLRYGGTKKRAPMVTWIMRFTWDKRVSTDSEAVYRDSLSKVLVRRGCIDAQGGLKRC